MLLREAGWDIALTSSSGLKLSRKELEKYAERLNILLSLKMSYQDVSSLDQVCHANTSSEEFNCRYGRFETPERFPTMKGAFAF